MTKNEYKLYILNLLINTYLYQEKNLKIKLKMVNIFFYSI